jgi:hypothetical protein
MALAVISVSLHLLASFSSTEPFISASDIDAYLTQKLSPLAGLGSVHVENGIRFDIDPRLVVAIAGAETTFGTNMGCNAQFNAWSWFWNDPNDCPNNELDSWEDGIYFVTRQMSLYRTRFLQESEAFTIRNIGLTYCAEGREHWESNVTKFYADELGGDTTDLGFSLPSNIQVDIFCNRWPNDSYYVQGGIVDPNKIIRSASIIGSNINESIPFVYELYRPGEWWTESSIFVSQGAEPNFPLSYTVRIWFKDGTFQEVNKIVTTWIWAQ